MMQDDIRIPRHKKPVKIRKPSKPLDGINHRLLREQAEAKAAVEAVELVDTAPEDDAAPTRAELEAKAKELGIRFDGRTGDNALLQRINEAMKV
tara:strand:+ start:208 stop:489 length:282 start_codon:yes stop_codon:yes gene_type:complete